MPAEVRSLYVQLSANATAFRGQMVGAAASVRQFGTHVLDMSDRSKRAMDDIGRGAGRMALVTGGALALMGKAAMDWESQWAGVAKTVDGTADELSQLEADLRELARTMPATHQEIAATAAAAGQLGVAVGDIKEFTRVMLQLGETTNLTADEAATQIAQLMNVLGTVPDQVDEIGNTLVDLGNKGASTEAEILALAQRLSGAGQLIGASEADVLGMASAMANLGIQAELGGGAMSRVIAIMQTAVSDGGEALAGFADVAGTSAGQFAEQWQRDPMRAIDAFVHGLQGVDQSGGNVITTMADLGIKGTQNRDVMLRLAGAGDMLTVSLDQSADAWEKNSALTEEFGKRAETTGSQVEVAWNRIKDAGIEGGEAILPVLADVSERAGDMADSFGKLPDPVQASVTRLLALSAIVGGGVWTGAKLITFAQKTRDTLQALTVTSDRTGSSLGRLSRTAGRITLLAGAVSLLGDAVANATGAKLDVNDLQRDLEGLAEGRATEVLDRIVSDMERLEFFSNKATEPLYELSTGFGLLGNTPMDTAAGNIAAIDEALASMVESGNVEEAARIFDRIASKKAGLPFVGSFDPSAFDDYDSYVRALENAAPAADDAADATDDLAGATSSLGDSAGSAAVDVAELVRSMQKQREAALGAFDAETQYRQALKDAQEQAAKNSAGIRGSSDDVLANREALASLAAAWNNQSKAVKNNEQRFKEAKGQFIDTAIAMGVPEQKAKDLAKAVLDIPRSRVIDVDANTDQAMSAMDRVRRLIETLDGMTATTLVRTVYQHQNKLPDIPVPGQDNADGGFYVSGRRFADGGFGQDGRYYPRVPQIVRGGTNVLWGEQETGWEAYVSGKPGMRARNVSILGEAARRFGYDLQPRGRESVSGGTTVIQHINRMPRRLELVVDGRSFTAYVRGHAGDVARETYGAAAGSRISSERKDW